MARDPYIEQRLINWSKWVRGNRAGGLGFATMPWEHDGADRQVSAPVMPEGEEYLTDAAVRAMELPLQDAVVVQYIDATSAEKKAQKLGVTVQTLKTRVQRAHVSINRWLAERNRAAEAERERVEKLIASIRPR